MTGAQTPETMSPQLAKVVERAARDPQATFHSLAHLIDVELLRVEFHALRADAAVGVDGVTTADYAVDLERKLTDLHARLKAGSYRHQPIRRVHLPKGDGRTRPIGIATTEDKIVQGAVRTVLQAVYEPLFAEGSYGFRPRRRAHDALRAINRAMQDGTAEWVLEADIESFFDSISRSMLREMLQHRVADGSLLRLVGKCLHVGVLDGVELTTPETGTAQGSALSPLLGNIFLHYVLDRWFEQDVQPRLRGRARLIRYADDFVLLFEREDDARRVAAVLPQRMAKHGLTLHPTKTRLLPMQRPPFGRNGGKGPGSYEFLGFTVFWRRSRRGTWVPGMQTARTRMYRARRAVQAFCRSQRHEPLKVQHAGLVRRLQGHFNYFGIQGNGRRLDELRDAATEAWCKWLNRRSQRARMTWARFKTLLRVLPLPRPTIRVRIWAPAP